MLLKEALRKDHDDLSSTTGDQINTLLASAAYNMKKWIRLKKEGILYLYLNKL